VKNKYLVVESVIFVLSDVKVFRINVSSFRVRHNGLYKKRFNAFLYIVSLRIFSIPSLIFTV
jgi:membrane protein CcdC involved in cytochrome C biogenesis